MATQSETLGQSLTERVRRVELEQARRRLIRFAQEMRSDYEAQWFHRLVADKLDAVRRGEILRLLVFIPPQHGKSELVSRLWPAHLLGNNPNTRIIATSYSDDLASFNARHVKRLMYADRYHQLFSRFDLFDKKVRGVANQASFFEIPKHDGYYLSAGIMGGMTGFGFDVGIIDDPIKNQQEADSPTYRERLKAAFHSVFETRGRGMASKDGIPDRIVGLFTRWHHDDLAGYITELAKQSGDKWEIVSLPAILDSEPSPYDERKHGQALWPSRYPATLLEKRKRNMPARTWDALYQQRPSPSEGGTFQKSWWRYYDPREVAAWLADDMFDEVFQSWDCGFKKEGTSRVCGGVFASKGADLYILDLIVEHMSYVETRDAITRMSKRWPNAYTKLIEDKANGPAIISDLARILGGMTAWPPKGVKMASKEERWNAASPPVRSGNVYLPPPLTPWVDGFITELSQVPHGQFDDQADAFAQAVAYWRGDGGFLEALTRW